MIFQSFVWIFVFEEANTQNTVQAILQLNMLFGVAQTHISDRGSHFGNAVVQELNKCMGTQIHSVHAHCSWANGTAENMNRQIRKLMRAMISESGMRPTQNSIRQLFSIINYSLNSMPRGNGHTRTRIFTG